MLNKFFGWGGITLGILGIVVSIWQTNYVFASVLAILVAAATSIAYFLYRLLDGPPYRAEDITVSIDFTNGRKEVPCTMNYKFRSYSNHNASIAFDALRADGDLSDISYNDEIIRDVSRIRTPRGTGITFYFKQPKKFLERFELEFTILYKNCFDQSEEYVAHDLAYSTKNLTLVARFPANNSVRAPTFSQTIGGERKHLSGMKIKDKNIEIICSKSQALAGERYELNWLWALEN